MRKTLLGSSLAIALWLTACGQNVNSEVRARQSYQGLGLAVEKSLRLGFSGFAAASSANIPTQTGTGDASGTLTVTGQVDQGSSNNKGMRLQVALADYSDGEVALPDEAPVDITYRTADGGSPSLELSLRNIPSGTFTGTLKGDFAMTGDVEGSVTLDLTMSGQLEDDGTGKTRRKAGTTQITGTATAQGARYAVQVTR